MKNYLSLSLIGLFLSMPSLAGTNFATEVSQRLTELSGLPETQKPGPDQPACLDRYTKLYKDGVLNVAIGFGYWDNSPDEYVFDSFIANGLRYNLTAPCKPGINVCGFKKAGDVYTKMIKGPDGKPNRFSISITFGSLSDNNLANTTTNKETQDKFCENAKAKFFGEVSRGSEVVMYIGHSRDGGGPDFCPPVREANKHTNYPWYRKNRPGIKALLSAMDTAREAGRQNQVVGMYSCSSKLHFYKSLSAKNPGTGLILTTNEISSIQAITSLVSTVDSLMAKKCSKDFQESLDFAVIVKQFGMF